MAIQICNDRIIIGDVTICEASDGICIKGGIIRARQLQDIGEGLGGSNAGFQQGGSPWFGPAFNAIQRYSFTSGNDARRTGNLTTGREFINANLSGPSHGYTAGGAGPPFPSGSTNVIDRFPFAVDANAVDFGDLTSDQAYIVGNFSRECGYTVTSTTRNKFPFSATATNASPISASACSFGNDAGINDNDRGYMAGATYINSFSFASDATVSCVGSIPVSVDRVSGHNSTCAGYIRGGGCTTIFKFPFATGNIIATPITPAPSTNQTSGTSSTICGYTSTGTVFSFQFANETEQATVVTLPSGGDIGGSSHY